MTKMQSLFRTTAVAIAVHAFVLVPAVVTAMDMKGMETTPQPGATERKPDAGKRAGETAHAGTGVVRKIDSARGVVTLDHTPIPSIDWPAMTMGFKVRDKAMLDGIKVGDRVQFTLVPSGKDYVVTSIK